MADGNVFRLVEGVLGPVEKALDYIFYAGLFYGAKNLSRVVYHAYRGIRTYFIPIGRDNRKDLSKKYGKWAVITGGTSGIGLAYAYEVSLKIFWGAWLVSLARQTLSPLLLLCYLHMHAVGRRGGGEKRVW